MSLETSLQQQWSSDIANELENVKIELSDARSHLADITRAKARLSWLKDGDRNSKFFHAMIRSRNISGQVRLEQNDGTYTDDRSYIGNKAADFFRDIFNGPNPSFTESDFAVLDSDLSSDDNSSLCALPNATEIRDAISHMNHDSAPGPDGFSGHFYNSCWDIIKSDLIEAIRAFFQGHRLPTMFSATHLVLLPKVASVTSVSQLRPISLCNFSHKIISHILMKRLAPLLPQFISDEQAGFVPGRSMHNNIALAHDLAHDLDKNSSGGNLIIKLDMAKAYDRVSWRFLIHAMRALGFCEQWCDLVYRCISNCSYSIKWEGDIFGFFRSSRGVRQGDPLSPSLFIIAMEWLSRSLNKAHLSGNIQPYNTTRRAIKITHLLFADDILLFANGEQHSMENMLDIIQRFCAISGENLNPSKSQIIFSSHHTADDRTRLCGLTHFAETKLPITYLGAPLYKGRTLASHFQFLITRVRSRIQGWAKNFLSMAGRAELIRSVLCAVGTHAMLTLPVPAKIIDNMISLMAAFLWDNGKEQRRHWISWDRICNNKDYGGLGIRHPKHMMLALHSKRAWEALTGTSLWARFVRSRFTIGRTGSPLWNAISPLIDEVKKVGSWRIGNGTSTGAVICRFYGVSCPLECSRRALCDMVSFDHLIWSLIGALPADERQQFRHIVFTNQPDRFVCKLTPDGTFTTKAYHDHRFAITNPVVSMPWGKPIWKPWIPPKISCFMWKLFHKVVPTDDTIRRITIPVTSRCSCCVNPSVETMDHLFFSSELATATWEKLSIIFDRPRPRGRGTLLLWLRGNRKDFLDRLASGMACCVIWEIWNFRNNRIHDNRQRPIWDSCIEWASRLRQLISAPYHASTQANMTLAALRIKAPHSTLERPSWLNWDPPSTGLAMDIAIHTSEEVWRAACLVRNSIGRFSCALCISEPFESVPMNLRHSLSQVREFLGDLSSQISIIRSSATCFWGLCDDRADYRSCKGIFPNICFRRTRPSQNTAASALLFTSVSTEFRQLLALPLPVRRAIHSDSSRLPTSSMIIPTHTQDDSAAPHSRYHTFLYEDH